MLVKTTGGGVSAVESGGDPDLLVVRARDRESLDAMLDAIELAGNAEGVERKLGVVKVDGYHSFQVVVPRATFAVWLQFEALNCIGRDEPEVWA